MLPWVTMHYNTIPPLKPKSLRLVSSPHCLLPMVLAFGGTSHGSDPLPPAYLCLLPAPNQASHSPPTSPRIADVGSECVSPRFPPHATLLHHPQSPLAEEDYASQVGGHCQLGRRETCVGLGGISLWQENQSHKYMVI